VLHDIGPGASLMGLSAAWAMDPNRNVGNFKIVWHRPAVAKYLLPVWITVTVWQGWRWHLNVIHSSPSITGFRSGAAGG